MVNWSMRRVLLGNACGRPGAVYTMPTSGVDHPAKARAEADTAKPDLEKGSEWVRGGANFSKRCQRLEA